MSLNCWKWYAAAFPIWLIAMLANRVCAIEVLGSAEPGGPTPQQLVEILLDSTDLQLVPGSVSTAINADGSPVSNPRAMGSFTGGLTPPGTFLPDENQPDPGNPTATYSGGIGIGSGVCLCTELTTDDDPEIDPASVPEGYGVGVEGPNNGLTLNAPPGPGPAPGEISVDIGKPGDADFESEVTDGFDAAALNFDIELQSPGILQITYVHATDEHPFFGLSSFNDSFLVFIRDPDSPNPQFANFIVFRKLIPGTGAVEEGTLSLADLNDCGFLLNNLVAPSPSEFLQSRHADFDMDGDVDEVDLANDRFDHEFGGFSVPLTFEAISPLPTSPLYRRALAPGVYNFKIVIQDVDDQFLDSAAFILENSLKLFALHQGDYNGDGTVDGGDYIV